MRKRLVVAVLAILFSFSALLVQATPQPSGLVTVIQEFDSGYTLLDDIPTWSLASNWQAESAGPFPRNVEWRADYTSPYDGSTALWQSVYSANCTAIVYRNFQLGKDFSPGAKVALFFKTVSPMITSGIESKIMMHFYKGTNYLMALSAGYKPMPEPGDLDLVVGPDFAGLLQFDTRALTESFDNFSVILFNTTDGGQSAGLIDEIRILSSGGGGGGDFQFTVSTPLLLIGKDEQSAGVLLKATTPAPATVDFKADNAIIESVPTVSINGQNVAKKIWFGEDQNGIYLPDGAHVVTATVGGQSLNHDVTIRRVPSLMIAFRIPAGGFDKDPTGSILPTPPDCFNCITDFVDEMGNKQPGIVSSVLVGDPVNIVSGNYSLPVIDLRLKSRISLVLSRLYNSLDKTSGPFGKGWTSLLFTKLENTSATPSLRLSDGSKVLFQKQGDVFVSEPAYGLKLSFSEDTGFWLLANPQGSEWHFDGTGKIIRMANQCCGRGATDALTFEYDGQGFLSKIRNPEGQFFTFTNDAAGRITAVTDSAGRTVSYRYDGEGNLTACTDPVNRVTTYSYDDQSFLTRVTAPGSRTISIEYQDLKVSKITFPDGRSSTFAWDLDGKITTLTDPKGVKQVYEFDESWNLKKFNNPGTPNEKNFEITGNFVTGFRNPVGSTRSYTYDTNGLLTAITDSFGNVWRYEYHPTTRKLTKETDPLGRVWAYTWCSRGNLIAVTNPLGGRTTFRYDQWNNQISQTDPLGRVERDEYDPGGNRILKHIYPDGGVSSFSYDARGNLIAVSDPLGRRFFFEYDLRDRLIKTANPDGSFVVCEYDLEGRLAAKTDNLGRRSEFTYDVNGRLLSVKHPNGAVISREYDENGRVISQTDPLGHKTRLHYNDLGHLTAVEYPDASTKTFEYDAGGRLIAAADEVLAKSRVEYDLEGRMTGLIDPLGNRSEKFYDAVGRLVRTKNAKGQNISLFYDRLDRVVKIERPDGTKVQNQYDAVGNLIKTIDPQGATWTWRYDQCNRPVEAVRPNGAVTRFTYDRGGQLVEVKDALGRTVKNFYDPAGRLSSYVDPVGGQWKNGYDPVGRLISETDPLGAVTSYGYDPVDNLTRSTDPLGNIRRFEYDLGGRRIAAVNPLGKRSIYAYDDRDRMMFFTDPEARRFSFSYDGAGRPVTVTDGASRVWRRNFDLMDRVVSETDPMGHAKLFEYDSLGNLLALTNARNNQTKYEYDSMNRVARIRYPDGTLATFTYDPTGREVLQSWNSGTIAKTWTPLGQMAQETFGPWGKGWRHEYDLVGNRVRSVSPEGDVFRYSYDKADRLAQLKCPDGDLSFSYDRASRLIETRRPGGVSKYGYDRAGRLLSLTHYRENGRFVLVARKYAYDAAGRCLSMTDEDNQATGYSYDGGGWLTGVVYPGRKRVSWEYNGAGDRIKEIIGSQAAVLYSYDNAGRMVSRGSDSFEYDGDGNLVKAVEGGLETHYFWSAENKLVRVERELPCRLHYRRGCGRCRRTFQVIEEYGYPPADWRRTTRKNDGHTFVSIYDGDDETHEYLQTPKALFRDWRFGPFCWKPRLPQLLGFREFVGGPGTDDLLATKYYRKALWHLTDGLGSTVALANRGGGIVARMDYDVWGGLRWPNRPGHDRAPCRENDIDDYFGRFESGRSFGNFGFDPWHFGRHFGPKLTPYLFAGRRYSPVTGLYFNRNRHYGPSAGRFVSPDPIGFAGGTNLWAYAGNSPANFTDPYGLELSPSEMAAALDRTVSMNMDAFHDTVNMNMDAFNNTVNMNMQAFHDTVDFNLAAFDKTVGMDLDKFHDTVNMDLPAFHRTVDLDIIALNRTLGIIPWDMPVYDMSQVVQECKPRRRRKPLLATVIPSDEDLETYDAARELVKGSEFQEYFDIFDREEYEIYLDISPDVDFEGVFPRRGKMQYLNIGVENDVDSALVKVFLGSKEMMLKFNTETTPAYVAHELLHEGLEFLDTIGQGRYDHPKIWEIQTRFRKYLYDRGLLYKAPFQKSRPEPKLKDVESDVHK